MLKALSIFGYLGMVGGLVWLLVTKNLFSSMPAVIVLQTGAFLLFLCARCTFGRRSYHVAANPTEGGLVTTGPYGVIRHPIYAAMCVFAWAGVAAHWTRGTILCGVLILGCAIGRIFAEEALVSDRYPEYKKYAARTWRLVPFVF